MMYGLLGGLWKHFRVWGLWVLKAYGLFCGDWEIGMLREMADGKMSERNLGVLQRLDQGHLHDNLNQESMVCSQLN